MKKAPEPITFATLLHHRKPIGSKEETCDEIVKLLNTIYSARKDLEKELLTCDAFYYKLLDYAALINEKHITIKDLLFRGNYTKSQLKAKLGAFLLNLKLFKKYIDNPKLGLKDELYKKWELFGFNTNKLNALKTNILNKKLLVPDWQYNQIKDLDEILHQASCRIVEIYAPLAAEVARKKGLSYNAQTGQLFSDWQDDLIQCGLMGLYTAAQHWDPTKNASFTTYAWYWIASEYTYFFQHIDVVDLPRNVITLRKKIDKVAAMCNVSKANASNFVKFVNKPVHVIENAMQQEGSVSLNDLVADEYEPDEKGLEFLTDGQNINEDVHSQLKSEKVQEIIEKNLKKKDKMFFEMKFGLNGYDTYTYKDLSKIFKLTTEGARIRTFSLVKKVVPDLVKLFGEEYGEEDTNKVFTLFRKKR